MNRADVPIWLARLQFKSGIGQRPVRHDQRVGVSWGAVAEQFEIDGSLKDIYVLDTSAVEWQLLLELIRSRGWRCAYSEDALPKPLPSAAEALDTQQLRATMLAFWPGGDLEVHAHFFTADQIELDLDPRTIQDQKGLDSVVRLLRAIGKGLDRSVVLTWENSPDAVILRYDPATSDVTRGR
jgi:hypothetical protein